MQKTSSPCAIPTWEAWHALRNGWDLNLLPWIWKGLQAGSGSAFVCKPLGNISGFLRLRLAVAWLDDELFWQTNNICFTPDCIWNVHQIAGQQLIERFSLKIPQLVVVRLFFSLQEACSRKKEQALCLSVFFGCSKANIYGHLDTKRKQGIAANMQRPLPAG